VTDCFLVSCFALQNKILPRNENIGFMGFNSYRMKYIGHLHVWKVNKIHHLKTWKSWKEGGGYTSSHFEIVECRNGGAWELLNYFPQNL